MLFPSDTSDAAARIQVQLWRGMSSEEKLRLVSGMTRATRELCLAGIRQRHPGASEDEVRLRYALIVLGPDLASKVYPEVARLT